MSGDPFLSSQPPLPADPQRAASGAPYQPLGYDDASWEESSGGSPFLRFTLWVTVGLIVLVLVAGGTAAVLLSRQHHLAEGYLFHGQGQLIYFSVSEGWYGGDVIGTFYPATTTCSDLGLVQGFSPHFSGTITNDTLTIKDDTENGGGVMVQFTRVGKAMAVTSASGEVFAVEPLPPGAVFLPSSDGEYTQAKTSFCPSELSGAVPLPIDMVLH